MNLTGKQTEQLQNAFLDTYNRADLEQFVSFKLDERLDNITSGGTMGQTVFELIEWAERHGRLADLIEAAHADRPSDPVFAAFVGGEPSPTVQTRSSPARTSPAQSNQKRSPRQVIGFIVGIIGLIASVITIVAYCKPPALVDPIPTPTSEINEPAETTEFTYGVTVLDADTSQPIANAQVTIEIGGKAPLDDFADSKGFARLVVPSAFASKPGRLIVSADSYDNFRQEIDLYPDRLPDTIQLKRSN